jgi:KUP system potassium uptake protein
MAHWRKELFSTMADMASSVVDYFKIPPNRVIELGTRVEI